MKDVLTADDLKRAMAAMPATYPPPHVHLVHPSLAGRRIALVAEDIDVTTRCASCGAWIGLTRPEPPSR